MELLLDAGADVGAMDDVRLALVVGSGRADRAWSRGGSLGHFPLDLLSAGHQHFTVANTKVQGQRQVAMFTNVRLNNRDEVA